MKTLLSDFIKLIFGIEGEEPLDNIDLIGVYSVIVIALIVGLLFTI